MTETVSHVLLLADFVRESNRIEDIHREPTGEEVRATARFLSRQKITVDDLVALVSVYAPGKLLREHPGMDVRVGNHIPQPGGPVVRGWLEILLGEVNGERGYDRPTPYAAHLRYEALHPFMDGNGRSGRALWLWMMGGIKRVPLGFLHTFYYQTLQAMKPQWPTSWS